MWAVSLLACVRGVLKVRGEKRWKKERERETAREKASTHQGGQRYLKTHRCLNLILVGEDDEFLTVSEMESRAILLGCQTRMTSQAGGLKVIWIILKFISCTY